MPSDLCPRCTADDLLSVALRPGGRAMRFLTCRRCEFRWWEDRADHARVDLPDVLTAIAAT